MKAELPRVLIIDDECGRTLPKGNNDRRNLCDTLGLLDVSSDSPPARVEASSQATAAAVFIRGQRPPNATVGDFVENDIESVIAAIRRGWDLRAPGELPWAMVLLDLSFCTGEVTAASHLDRPGMAVGRTADLEPASYFGLKILERIRADLPGVPVAILSSQERAPIDSAIDRLDHSGFVSKTATMSRVYLQSLLQRHGLFPDSTNIIVGHSTSLLLALRDARRLANTDQNVLLRGERGTGKELFARFLHQNSDRANRPFIEVNGGALPDSLSASELFGILANAATGVHGRDGCIVRADGGYLFMDEVGNLSEQVQGDLSRVIDDKIVMPVGMRKETDRRRVDVRFVFATNSDLDTRALAGTFKPDLLDRFRRGGTVNLPPLRSRAEDIPLLADLFLARARAELPDCMVAAISEEAGTLLQAQPWPGNVRQLEDCVRQTVLRHRDVRNLYPAQFAPLLQVHQVAASVPVEMKTALSFPTPLTSIDRTFNDESTPRTLPDQIPLKGSLAAVRAQHAKVLALLLRDAIVATSDVDGKPNYTGAVSLLLGRKLRDTTKAADHIKRLLKTDRDSLAELLLVSPLKDAWEWCWATRPLQDKKRGARGRPTHKE